jgi:hypothetical protein
VKREEVAKEVLKPEETSEQNAHENDFGSSFISFNKSQNAQVDAKSGNSSIESLPGNNSFKVGPGKQQ